MKTRNGSMACASAILVATSLWLARDSGAWDSAYHNPTHPTHTYITDWAINQLRPDLPELGQFRDALVDGANTELHELPVRDYEKKLGLKYGVDLEAKRKAHQGTNAGCNDIQGWWQDSLEARRQGNKSRAYFLLGVVLHMVEDMGVPAHANGVYHQGNLREFDNFEALAGLNWKPRFDQINRQDPGYTEPWRYYMLSKDWAHADAPHYNNRDSFPKFWLTANGAQRDLVSNRQGRTCHVVMWTLKSATKAFGR